MKKNNITVLLIALFALTTATTQITAAGQKRKGGAIQEPTPKQSMRGIFPLLQLPLEVIVDGIAPHLDGKSIAALSQTCRRLSFLPYDRPTLRKTLSQEEKDKALAQTVMADDINRADFFISIGAKVSMPESYPSYRERLMVQNSTCIATAQNNIPLLGKLLPISDKESVDCALLMAVACDSTSCVEKILATRTKHSPELIQPIYRASKRGVTPILKLLLTKAKDLGITITPDEDDYFPLHLAAEGGHASALQELLDAGLNPNQLGYCDSIEETFNPVPPLHAAVVGGNKDCIRALLDRHVNVNETGFTEKTALYHAAEQDDLEAVQLLLQAGADPNHHNEYDEMAIHFAARHGNVPMIKLLAERGSDLDFIGEDFENPIVAAISKGHTQAAETLLECGASIWAEYEGTRATALHVATKHNNIKIVEKILGDASLIDDPEERSRYINTRNRKYKTALHLAAETGKLEIVKKLVEAGASTVILDREGQTPILAAARKGQIQICEYLRTLYA